MLEYHFGGKASTAVVLSDHDDVVVVGTHRRGARHDQSPLSPPSRAALDELTARFGFSAAGVGVYSAPAGGARELSDVLHRDPEVRFAGRGLRDAYGAPVVYTENAFVKFVDGVSANQCETAIGDAGLNVKRRLTYARNAYFLAAPQGAGQAVFERVRALFEREDVELGHPELVREVGWNGAGPQQWHLQPAVIDGTNVDAHAHVVAAWARSRGDGCVIAVIDDGVDVGHADFAGDGKIVSPFSASAPRGEDVRPADGDNHGTACCGVAAASGAGGASGVAPGARLMPLRCTSGIGSQDEADAIVWAADHGADVISSSRGPVDGRWWAPDDPAHDNVVALPDCTRLAIDYATTHGRNGRGCVVVWAAGNGNESVDNDGYASYERVIAVAACTDKSTKALYSDHGKAIWCCFPSNDGGSSLTPGIWTTDRSGADGYNRGDSSFGDATGNYTNSFGGTSSACPCVAGVAALILACAPNLTAGDVKEIVRKTCDPIDREGGAYDENAHSELYGYGRVNADAAVSLAARSGG